MKRFTSRFLTAFCLTTAFIAGNLVGADAQTASAKSAGGEKNAAHKVDSLESIRTKLQTSPFILITAEDFAKYFGQESGAMSLAGNPCDTAVQINPGQTLNGQLTNTDCRLNDGSYIDFYVFNGTQGQQVTINLTSTAFDTYLFLLNQSGSFDLQDDDGGGGTNSRITATLPATAQYIIGANSFDANQFGAYSVTLNSSGGNTCTYTLSPTNTSVSATGGSFTFAVNTQAGCQFTAASNSAFITTTSTGTGSGTVTFNVAANTTGTARTGTITVGGQTFTVNQTTTAIRTRFDYDGDGRADISVFRPSIGSWFIQRSTAGFFGQQFGQNGDRPAPADYDGDNRFDVAVFRQNVDAANRAFFYISQSSNGAFRSEQFGTTGDIPVSGNFDAEQRAEVAVFRPTGGAPCGAPQSAWYFRPAAQAGTNVINTICWGTQNDRQAVGDYDGDGREDATVFRPSDQNWYILQSSTNTFRAVRFGLAADRLVQADYDGDGRFDIATFRDGFWFILQSSNNVLRIVQFGSATDTPVPADYTGDNRADIAVFRNGTWFIVNSSNGTTAATQFGATGDIPTPASYLN